MFCPNCRQEVSETAAFCIKCGYKLPSSTGGTAAPTATPTVPQTTQDPNEWLIALLLCIFLGGFGIHRFYTKNTEIGVAQLLVGLFSCFIISEIWALVDLILLITGNYRAGDGHIVKN